MKVAIIYNEPRNTAVGDHWLHRSNPIYADQPPNFIDASEYGVPQQMHSIADTLRNYGHELIIFSTDDSPKRLCSFLDEEKPDIIFNCCESFLGQSKLEMNVAAAYELFGIPYTGASALALGIALEKALAKSIFLANSIPTPKHHLFERSSSVVSKFEIGEANSPLRFPIIVKPVHEDASIGIDAKAIVYNEDELLSRIHFIQKEFEQPALAEEYIDGRELNVGVIGNANNELEVLPISEILFDHIPDGHPRIVSYEAKWVEESPVYRTTIPECPAKLPTAIANEAQRIALRAANAVGLRDYGRIDLRLDNSGNLFVLEANPNPDISEDAGFMRAARASGRTYAGTINEILNLAIERSKSTGR